MTYENKMRLGKLVAEEMMGLCMLPDTDGEATIEAVQYVVKNVLDDNPELED